MLYKKFSSFKTIDSNLRNWTGKIKLKNNLEITLVIRIPNDFPVKPPGIMVLEELSHKFVKNKRILVPYLKNWNERLHLYQVLNSIIVHFNKEYPTLYIKKREVSQKKLEKTDDFSFFDFELEKIALNELLEILRNQKKANQIENNIYKSLFNKYLTEIKRIEQIF